MDNETIEMALRGYEVRALEVQARITEIERELRGINGAKRVVSPLSRKRMAQAQALRWAKKRRAKKG